MEKIKDILDEIANESSTKQKMEILRKYKDNELLKEVLYKAKSSRVKFYIKQIPEYKSLGFNNDTGYTLEQIVIKVEAFSKREITGNAAISYLKSMLENSNPDDAYVLERIIEKDLKIGMGRTNINKVIPGLIEKTPYMGAKPYSEKLVKDLFEKAPIIKRAEGDYKIVYSQIKMDGRYANAIVNGNEVELVSRQGETTYVGDARFQKELEQLPDGVYNGELTVDGYDRYTANGMVSSIVDIEEKREKRGPEATDKKIKAFTKKHGDYSEILNKIRFTVWDVIELDEYFDKKSIRPYSERLRLLMGMVGYTKFKNVSSVELKTLTSYEEAIVHFKETIDRGLEGTILKSTDGGWKDGKPNWQVKMKVEMNLDLKIVGFNYGSKGTKNENVISTLQVESSCGELTTNPSGMDEDMMKFVTENQESLLNTIVEIRCCGLSQNREGNWSTLHPSVVKLRDDKDEYDSLESAMEIENMQKSLESK